MATKVVHTVVRDHRKVLEVQGGAKQNFARFSLFYAIFCCSGYSLSASSRGSRTIGGGSSRYSVDSRGRILVDGERHLNSKDGESGGVGGSSSGNFKNSSILVRNLPLRSTDSSLKDGLFFTYKKHGKVVSVKVVGEGPERYAVVTFRR